jgi:ketosteroid isomerase-like protein
MAFLRYALILPIVLMLAPSLAADTRDDILAAIEYYAELWNEGDLDALRGYYHSDFKLITASGVMTLEQRMADLEAVAEAGGDRGELSYADGEVMELGEKHALAHGRLSLRFKDGSSLDGWYSTLFVKTPFGWKALLTHS